MQARAHASSDRPLRRRGVLTLALALLAFGCRDRGREEAVRVMRALEQVRAAPNDRKQTPVEALAMVPCSQPIVCAARDRCAGVYQHLAQAEDRMRGMSESLKHDPPRTTEAIAELSSQLDRAEAEVNGFRQELSGCEEAASLMRRTYGI